MSRKITEKNAISILKTSKPRKGSYDRLQVAFDMAIKALEKQIPKKPLQIITDDNEYICMICPSCRQIAVALNAIHCWNCGQKLDWSEEDEQ